MVEVVVDAEMTIDGLRGDGSPGRRAKHPMVWLRCVEANAVIPIVIGTTEALSIYAELAGEQTLRPLTHDLFRTILDHFDAQVEDVRIVDLKKGVFYAELVLSWGGEHLCLDSRSSDGIALALKYQAPVYIAEEIVERAGYKDEPGLEGIGADEVDLPDPEETALDQDMMLAVEDLMEEAGFEESEALSYSLAEQITRLKKKMQRAVSQERYEEASQLRDEIFKLTDGQGDV
jgi:hypothetical protein